MSCSDEVCGVLLKYAAPVKSMRSFEIYIDPREGVF